MPHLLTTKIRRRRRRRISRRSRFDICQRARETLSVFEHVVVVVVVVFVGELIPKQKRDARRRRVTRTFLIISRHLTR